METMLAKHDLFTEDRMEKKMLLAVSDDFYMTAEAVREIAKFIVRYNPHRNVADVVHWIFTEVLDF